MLDADFGTPGGNPVAARRPLATRWQRDGRWFRVLPARVGRGEQIKEKKKKRRKKRAIQGKPWAPVCGLSLFPVMLAVAGGLGGITQHQRSSSGPASVDLSIRKGGPTVELWGLSVLVFSDFTLDSIVLYFNMCYGALDGSKPMDTLAKRCPSVQIVAVSRTPFSGAIPWRVGLAQRRATREVHTVGFKLRR